MIKLGRQLDTSEGGNEHCTEAEGNGQTQHCVVVVGWGGGGGEITKCGTQTIIINCYCLL